MNLPRVVRLLVSVRDVAEATAAHQGGADIIDIKEPSAGSLGMASPETMLAIRRSLPASAFVTAALGELMETETPSAEVLASLAGLWLVKAGTSHVENRIDAFDRFYRWSEQLGPNLPLIPAVYADGARCGGIHWETGLEWARKVQSPALLIDTYFKDGRRLSDWLNEREQEAIADACREAGLLLAWAGSLSTEDLTSPSRRTGDILAVRGAACLDGIRTKGICSNRVRALADLLGRDPISHEGRSAGKGIDLGAVGK
ncbi:(5-formylfuran-3-yl)methyl phosphate synthase [bacterium]|nr:(5-formylfuran-3-yl)methyl phosphate synthase [bacterium]